MASNSPHSLLLIDVKIVLVCQVKAIVSRGVQRTDVKYPAPLPSSKGASKYSELIHTPNDYSDLSPPTKYLEPSPSTKRFSKYSEQIRALNKYSEPSPSTKYSEPAPSTKRFSKYSELIHTPNKYLEPSPSTKSLSKYSEPLRVFSEYSEPAAVQSSSSSVDSSGLSDSSSGEEGAGVLPDLDTLLLEGGGWEEYMLADCELPLGKSNCCELLPKSGELYGWTDDCPLFTAEDLDAIGEISGNVHGPLDGVITVKQEPRDELELLDDSGRVLPQQRSGHRGYYVQA